MAPLNIDMCVESFGENGTVGNDPSVVDHLLLTIFHLNVGRVATIFRASPSVGRVAIRVVTVLAFSVLFGLRAFDIFVRVFFGLSGHDYHVNKGYLVANKGKTCIP